MGKQGTADKRQRRERGSINPDDIIRGAFDLAEQISVDNLSMPLLSKHLDVGVTSIYWYFRKKDDLLNAMTDRVLLEHNFIAPFVDASHWRRSLLDHAYEMRETFMGNPLLTDLVLIRGALSTKVRRLAVLGMEQAVESLVKAGLSEEDAYNTYSAVSLHVRGAVVLARLADKTRVLQDSSGDDTPTVIDETSTPVLVRVTARGRRLLASDEQDFQYGLDCLLDHAETLIRQSKSPSRSARRPRPVRKVSTAQRRNAAR
jgi:AcrR family transcriptional regulator